jgi:hypothetical protein
MVKRIKLLLVAAPEVRSGDFFNCEWRKLRMMNMAFSADGKGHVLGNVHEAPDCRMRRCSAREGTNSSYLR